MHLATRIKTLVAWLAPVALAAWLSWAPVAAQESWDPDGVLFGEFDEPYDMWRARVEYQFWWTKGDFIPPLVSGSPPGTPRAQAGVLGTPGATVLYGNGELDAGVRSGGRVLLTRWLDVDQTYAIEFAVEYLGDDRQSGNFVLNSPGSPIVSRPFWNATTNVEDAQLVAYPGVLAGQVSVQNFSEIISPDIYIRYELAAGTTGRIDWLMGYRYLRLRESLTVTENLTSTDPGGLIPLGTTTDLQDRFNTKNEFYGGELGVSAEFDRGFVTFELLGKLAIGSVQQNVGIEGETVVTVPGLAPTTTSGGLLSQPTNIGNRRSSDFAVLPEFGATMSLNLLPGLSLNLGYSLLMLNDVARPGSHLDRTVNPSQIGGLPLVGASRPAFAFTTSDFWAQSINVGFDARW